ncbi:hypothetical protein AQUCO_08600048v1 [Aquilegia coerulea]|uniref:CCHC-type domain-containing protein n=1 Tax=Aquilegia coerulea TaxID=218851 RepID=A0A2G5C6I5_AQUCA|nr:hypothetical protein AQUCO_08600048v1 [Aquilegia coerulea]
MDSRGDKYVGKYESEKFNGKNDFGFGQTQMKYVLVVQKLHKALLGRSKKPATMTEEEFDDMDLEAVAAICLCLDKKLEFLYMTKNLMNKMLCMKELYTLKMEYDASMRDHVAKFSRVRSNLKDVDLKVDDEQLCYILMFSLPDSYEGLVQTMLDGKDMVTYDEVCATLLSNEVRKQSTNTESGGDQSQGLVARGKSSEWTSTREKSTKSSIRLEDVICYNCGENGHYARTCPHTKKYKKNSKRKKR